LALTSGTAALHLALLLLDVGPGDEVLVPTQTFVATANVVTYVGARPVLVDSDPATWTIDPALVAGRARDPVPPRSATSGRHDRRSLWAVRRLRPAAGRLRRVDVPLIEDAAEALGARYRGRAAGSFGAAAVFSFNGKQDHHHEWWRHARLHDDALISRARYLLDPGP